MRIIDKWDNRFFDLARHIATWSKDPSRGVGCVIVDEHRRIVSTGFNGFPPGVIDDKDRYNNRDVKLMLVKHAEDNALAFSDRRYLKGCTLYSTLFPCSQCAGAIVRAGVSRVAAPRPSQDDRYKESFEWASSIFTEAGVVVSFM